MHVRIGATGELRHKLVAGSSLNAWHELVVRERISRVNGPRSSCGVPVTGFYAIVDEAYDGELCTVCFTPFELQFSAEIRAAKAEEERLELLKHGGRTKSQRRRAWKEQSKNIDEDMKKLTADRLRREEEDRRRDTERMRRLLPDGTQLPDDDTDKEKP